MAKTIKPTPGSRAARAAGVVTAKPTPATASPDSDDTTFDPVDFVRPQALGTANWRWNAYNKDKHETQAWRAIRGLLKALPTDPLPLAPRKFLIEYAERMIRAEKPHAKAFNRKVEIANEAAHQIQRRPNETAQQAYEHVAKRNGIKNWRTVENYALMFGFSARTLKNKPKK